MTGLVRLAALYLWRHAGRSALIVAILAVLAAIPMVGARLAGLAAEEMTARAATTPLIYGPAGGALELTLDALFFTGAPDPGLTMADYESLASQELGTVIPVLRTHAAHDAPIVGVDVEYLEMRELVIAEGRPMVLMGEAVAGAAVARRLGLTPGAEVQSDARGAFDIAGSAPVRLQITGVLAPTGMADDEAILTTLRSAWLVAGLAHGHEDLAEADEAVVLSRDEEVVVANARLREAIRVTDTNRGTFHFHGAPEGRPLGALLVFPHDARAAALLRGRVEDAGDARQLIRPTEVVGMLLDDIFRVRALFELATGVLGTAGIAALAGMVALTLRFRRPEFELARRIGADRGAVVALVSLELAILLAAGLVLAAGLTALVDVFGRDLYLWLLFGAA
jgi:putative ABC transport system permease protein